MPQFVLIHVCMEHCENQSGLYLTIDLEKISKDDFPLTEGKQVFFQNPKFEGYSSGCVVLVYNDIQNKLIMNSISSSRHPSFI